MHVRGSVIASQCSQVNDRDSPENPSQLCMLSRRAGAARGPDSSSSQCGVVCVWQPSCGQQAGSHATQPPSRGPAEFPGCVPVRWPSCAANWESETMSSSPPKSQRKARNSAAASSQPNGNSKKSLKGGRSNGQHARGSPSRLEQPRLPESKLPSSAASTNGSRMLAEPVSSRCAIAT